MAKMTIKQKKEYFLKLAESQSKIDTDPAFIDFMLDDHLKYVPHKKLYKFRTCSETNFQTLEENCIWMAPASEFLDPFDSTINIDIERNAAEIEEWIHNNYLRYYYEFILQICDEAGIHNPYTFADFEEYDKYCIDAEGNLLTDREIAFLQAHTTSEESLSFDVIYRKLNEARAQLNEHAPKVAEQLIFVIENARMQQRHSMLTYCMTEHYDNHSLWENYAGQYTGFCIEYSFDNYKKTSYEIYKNLLYLIPMTYRKRKPYFNMVSLMDGVMRECVLKDPFWKEDQNLTAELNLQMYYKHSDYQFEREWRFSIKNNNNNKQYFPFVKSIYAGKEIKKQDLKRLFQIANKLSVPLYRQELNASKNEFQYTFVQEKDL